jgi:hypothetical protein
MQKAPSGLQLIASKPSDQWQRQNISTVNPVESWHTAPGGSVTYSVDIKETTGNGWESHIYVTPVGSVRYNSTDSAPDWNNTNCLFFQFSGNNARFMFKTNQSGGNSQLWNEGTVAVVTGNSPTGTFSVKMTPPNLVEMTAPGGAVTNFTMPAEAAAMFNDMTYVYYGIQMNNFANEGKYSVFSRARITGVTTPVDDSFTGPGLNTNIWNKAGADNAGIFVNDANARFWFNWTLPASSDAVVVSKAAIEGKWAPAGLTDIVQMGPKRQVLVTTDKLPSPNGGFFALKLREATKLLVVLPGETVAFGSAPGKTGTPDPQIINLPVQVKVYAVDDSYNLVASNKDTVKITTTDATATLPADAALVSGTATFDVTFNAAGAWTVTASDLTDPSKTPGTASIILQ